MSSPHHVTNAATKGIVDKVSERLGKSETYVYSMGENPEKDRYTRFLTLYYAIAAENFYRADILFRDFEARRNAIDPGRRCRETSEKKALASVSEKINDVMTGHLNGKANHEKLRDIAEAEEALRVLTQAILREGEGKATHYSPSFDLGNAG